MNNSINVLLHGGLGNHLFQYAAAKTVAKKFENSNIKFFCYNKEQHPSYLKIENFIKNIQPVYFSNSRNLFNLLKRYLLYRFKCKLIIQKYPWNTDLNDFEINSLPITLDGYFGNPSWHQNSRSEVLKEMYEDRPKIFDKIIEEKNNVLAFRRGDFVGAGIALNIKYYLEAIEKLRIEKKSTLILLGDNNSYLDEIEKAFVSEGYKVKLNYKNNLDNVPSGCNDFFTMATSNKLIIANSTFQWWAANMRKTYGLDPLNVCIPDPWFPKKDKDLIFCGNSCNWVTSNSYF